MSDRPQPPHVLRWQTVLNMHWPRRPRAFRTHWPGIPVHVRIIWQRDGVEYLPGTARRWDAGHVYVEVPDHDGRLRGNGVWVKPADVYRREPDPADSWER